MSSKSFEDFFRAATGCSPFLFQREFALAPSLAELVLVPTGLGKTAMAVVGWLWRSFVGHEELKADTPRRLVYCLPMRSLVEQTRDCALDWLERTDLLAGRVEREPEKGGQRGKVKADTYRWEPTIDRVGVHVLMGGEDADEWDLHPEHKAIIIGTQDMLVSRALNRGYAAGRSRWPIQFGLLNTDCLWVFDEIQLMGVALATTTQLEAFRRLLPEYDADPAKGAHGCRSMWMSATMEPNWLGTVDFAPFLRDAMELVFDFEKELSVGGLDERARKTLEERWKASKPLAKAQAPIADYARLALEVLNAHKTGTRTIVVLNTVERARGLFNELDERTDYTKGKGAGGRGSRRVGKAEDGPAHPSPKRVLLHSRFRPRDRRRQLDEAVAEIQPGEPGTIVVSTQVIEAGVDVSAATLFTELAPWASLVQRFGRCNRRGDANQQAAVRWIDVPDKQAAPYEVTDLRASATQLHALVKDGVGLGELGAHIEALSEDDRRVLFRFEHTHVIRRKDLVDLFDTTPDLAGNDLDIDRFVRDIEDTDVRVFWRVWSQPKGYETPEGIPPVSRDELCPAPLGQFREFALDKKREAKVWRWNFLDGKWERIEPNAAVPGQVFLVHAAAGGYTDRGGWDPAADGPVDPVPDEGVCEAARSDAIDADQASEAAWRTVAEHTNEVCRELDAILKTHLVDDEFQGAALRVAAQWHDLGKTHAVFQDAIDDGQVEQRPTGTVVRRERPGAWRGGRSVAKAPGLQRDSTGKVVDPGFWRRYTRKGFRHELASALAVLDPRNILIPDRVRDLAAYLVAAHHGKVRLSIRSFPNETRPSDRQATQSARRFARGVWDGDRLPPTDLGGDVTSPPATLSLDPMELGLCQQHPFAGQPSWAERMIGLRDTIGPFRLAFLEAILRAADMRASAKAGPR